MCRVWDMTVEESNCVHSMAFSNMITILILSSEEFTVAQSQHDMAFPFWRYVGFCLVVADVRNDFYVTINSGDFRQGKIAPGERNIEITMEVCSRDGKPLGVSSVHATSYHNQYNIPPHCEKQNSSPWINDIAWRCNPRPLVMAHQSFSTPIPFFEIMPLNTFCSSHGQ